MSNPITKKTLRDADWKLVYSYNGVKNSFKVYTSDDTPGLTITHDLKGDKIVRTIYSFQKKRTDSPMQIIRWFNAAIRNEANGGRPPVGSAEQIAQRRASTTGL